MARSAHFIFNATCPLAPQALPLSPDSVNSTSISSLLTLPSWHFLFFPFPYLPYSVNQQAMNCTPKIYLLGPLPTVSPSHKPHLLPTTLPIASTFPPTILPFSSPRAEVPSLRHLVLLTAGEGWGTTG